jgi:hypothetical protein
VSAVQALSGFAKHVDKATLAPFVPVIVEHLFNMAPRVQQVGAVANTHTHVHFSLTFPLSCV